MGIQDLQTFLENEGVGVDLFRIARNHAGGFRLVLDAEGCLDRLYGGYFSDWACGGQWARCVQFLTTLAQALAEHQVALCVCFNGAHPTPPALPQHWIQTQATYRQRVNSVLRHIVTKGTPPPKVWWVPPMGLHSCLRTALRYLNIPIVLRHIVTKGTPPPKVWWVPPMGLHSCLRTALRYLNIPIVLRHIVTKGTPPPKVWWVPPMGLHSCLRTALRYLNIPIMVSSDDHCQEVVGLCREKTYAGLVGCSGEYLVFQPPRYFSSSQLKLTYRSSLETKEYMVHELPQVLEVPQDRLCLMAALLGGTILSETSLTDFYKRLGITQKKQQVPPEALVKAICQYVRELPSSDIDAACIDVFGDLNDLRAAKLKQAVQYYLNGTKDGFLKYRTASGRRPKNNKKNQKADLSPQATSLDLDTSKLAAESSEHEQKGLDDYKLATANASINADFSMEERSTEIQHGLAAVSLDSGDASAAKQQLVNPADKNEKPQTAPKEGRPTTKAVHCEDNCPAAPAEVLRTCAERHARGLMHPHMLSILTHRQVTLPVLMEDDNHREIPSIHHFFRPVRQNVYAILYNMHHHRFMAQKAKEEGSTSSSTTIERPCTVQIAEWIYSRVNPGKSPEIVQGVVLDWPVPTVQRLWFGTAQDDKCRRMRAFLSCMRSDTPLMLNTSYVPQHLLILATVLRFIMTSQIQILRRQELDAFLATAFSNDLMNALHLQEMTVSVKSVSGINSRGVQLGALVMAGAEAALLANDACGAPVPWLVAAPWLYFDGKLLQRNLHRASHCKHLAQLCDNHLDTVVKVERMRKAILEGLEVEFAMPPLPLVAGVDEPAKPTTLTVNGKTVRPEDINQQEEGSPHEDASAADTDADGAQPQKIKTAKNAKKNMGKGKKKSSNQKSDLAQTLEANGPLDKNKVAEQCHNSEKEHIGQGDAPVSN
uniref:Constitutive coactivator of PPAR-gamma-like protein 1 n=1 Tax=Heliothis virescens TaxID=7102 RepID=A0A2A4JEZ2_HELVI